MEKYFILKDTTPKTEENLAWEKEANVWANLYIMYDDNEQHMSDSFYNNNYDEKSAAELHTENVNFAKFFLSMSYDAETDNDVDAEIKAYFAEAKKAA